MLVENIAFRRSNHPQAVINSTHFGFVQWPCRNIPGVPANQESGYPARNQGQCKTTDQCRYEQRIRPVQQEEPCKIAAANEICGYSAENQTARLPVVQRRRLDFRSGYGNTQLGFWLLAFHHTIPGSA